MKSEATANVALAEAAARIDWEDKHNGAWLRPAPQRRRNDPLQRAHRACDRVLLVLLAGVLAALTMGAL